MPRWSSEIPMCEVDGCLNRARTRSSVWCKPHLTRVKRWGDPLAQVPVRPPKGGKVPKVAAAVVPRPDWAVTYCMPCHRWVSTMMHPPSVALETAVLAGWSA